MLVFDPAVFLTLASIAGGCFVLLVGTSLALLHSLRAAPTGHTPRWPVAVALIAALLTLLTLAAAVADWLTFRYFAGAPSYGPSGGDVATAIQAGQVLEVLQTIAMLLYVATLAVALVGILAVARVARTRLMRAPVAV